MKCRWCGETVFKDSAGEFISIEEHGRREHIEFIDLLNTAEPEAEEEEPELRGLTPRVAELL